MSQGTEPLPGRMGRACALRMLSAAAGLAAVSLAVAWPGAAAAEQAIRYTTYLRDGPGVRYRVLQEALTGTQVVTGACADGWCQVRYGDAVGYVAQGTLRTVPPPPAPGPRTCFTNRQAGYLDGRALTLCYSATATPPGPPR